jgi:hypothetical protein
MEIFNFTNILIIYQLNIINLILICHYIWLIMAYILKGIAVY